MKNFEEKLKSNLDNYEIKTSSEDILNRFEKENKLVTPATKVNSKKKGLFFGLSFGTIALIGASLVIAFTLPGLLNKDDGKNLRPTLSVKESNLLTNELSLLNYNFGSSSTNTTTSFKDLIKNANQLSRFDSDSEDNDDEDTTNQVYDFNQLVDAFNLASDSFYFLSNDLESSLKTVVNEDFKSFTYENVTYYNESSLYNNDTLLYTIYSNYTLKEADENEWNFTGILKENDNYYKINGTKELNSINNEYEIECNIVKNNKLYSVKREIEFDESSYEFEESSLDDKEIYSYEINFDTAENETTVEITKGDEYEFIVNKIDGDNYKLNYNDYLITLKYSNNEKTYTNDAGEAIIKKDWYQGTNPYFFHLELHDRFNKKCARAIKHKKESLCHNCNLLHYY